MSTPEQQLPQARSVAIPKRLPMLNPIENRQSSKPLLKDPRLINCYGEYSAQDDSWWVYKRPGLSQAPVYNGNGAAQGIHFSPNGNFFSVSGGELVCYNYVWNASATFGGYPVTPWSIEDVSTAGAESYTAATQPGYTGITLLTYHHGAGNWVLTTPAFPSNIPLTPGIVYLDTTAYVMDAEGNIYGSNTGDPTTWSGLNVIEASSTPDFGVGIAKQLIYLVAFKQNVTQVFYDEGNATGSPLGPVQDATIPFGCFNGFSIATIDNIIFWVTNSPKGSPQVAVLNNLTPEIISWPSIDRILSELQFVLGQAINVGSGFPIFQGLNGFCFRKAGHTFYAITCVPLNITLVYDIYQKLWYIWTDANGNYWPIYAIANQPQVPNAGGTAVQTQLCLGQQSATGNIYQVDDCYIYPTDYGTLPPVDIYTPNYDGGTIRRKYLRTMYFDGDKVPSKLKARWSEDDYQTFSNFREVDLNLKKPRLSDCGTIERRRAYHFRHQAPTGFRMKNIDLQVDIGTL